MKIIISIYEILVYITSIQHIYKTLIFFTIFSMFNWSWSIKIIRNPLNFTVGIIASNNCFLNNISSIVFLILRSNDYLYIGHIKLSKQYSGCKYFCIHTRTYSIITWHPFFGAASDRKCLRISTRVLRKNILFNVEYAKSSILSYKELFMNLNTIFGE